MKSNLIIIIISAFIILTSCEDEPSSYDPSTNTDFLETQLQKKAFPKETIGEQILDLAVSEQNEFLILTGDRSSFDFTDRILYSNDDGASWNEINKFKDPKDVYFLGPSIAYANDTAMYVSNDLGRNWTRGFNGKVYLKSALSLNNEFVMAATSYDRETDTFLYGILVNSGEDWTFNSGLSEEIMHISFQNTTIIATTSNSIYYTRDKGVSWTKAFDIPFNNDVLTRSIVIGDNIYYITQLGVVYKTAGDISFAQPTLLSNIYSVDDFYFANRRVVTVIQNTTIYNIFELNDNTYFMDYSNGIFELSPNGSVALIENLYPSIYEPLVIGSRQYFIGNDELTFLDIEAYITELKENYKIN